MADNELSGSGSRTTNARRSRAERAKAERDRRRRSTSRTSSDVQVSVDPPAAGSHSTTAAATNNNTTNNNTSSGPAPSSSAQHYERSSSSSSSSSSSNTNTLTQQTHVQSHASASTSGHHHPNKHSSSTGNAKTNTTSTSQSRNSKSNMNNNPMPSVSFHTNTNNTLGSNSNSAASEMDHRMEEKRFSKEILQRQQQQSQKQQHKQQLQLASRHDMSPTGRMRLEQQYQHQQHQQVQSHRQHQPQQQVHTPPTQIQTKPKVKPQPPPLQIMQTEKIKTSSTKSSSTPTSSTSNTKTTTNIQTPSSSKIIPTNITTNTPSPTSTNPPTTSTNPKSLSIESPLPPLVQRALGDRSYEKRKNAALEIEGVVKHLADSAMSPASSTYVNNEARQMIFSLIQILSKDFCTSMNSNYRKGGLIGLAATGIGLMSQQLTPQYLEYLMNPVIHCFDDPEARVRYYACESLYNIVKVARGSILPYFNLIFDGLTKLFADVDDDVKNGANLLDRLVKDIVTECEEFSVDEFLPLLQNYIRRTNPYIRQLIVGWIMVLNGIPDISMIDYLPDFLDGLFNMLSDSNREIRQAADSVLCEFLKGIRTSTVVEFGPIVSILVFQCHSKERLNRLTAVTWLAELIHHPHLGGDSLLPFHAEILSAVMACISDAEIEIRKISERTNSDLLNLVNFTKNDFELRILLDSLTKELTTKDDVPTKMAALKWINMLLEKRRRDMNAYTNNLIPVLLQSLSDSSDGVVLLTVQVLSRITLSDKVSSQQQQLQQQQNTGQESNIDDAQFLLVIKAILALFASDRRLLETRGSLIVRRLCVLLNAKSVYIIMAEIISSYDLDPEIGDSFTLEFVATMIQTLNLLLLTASELNNLRKLLAQSFSGEFSNNKQPLSSPMRLAMSYGRPSSSTGNRIEAKNEGAQVFASLFHCWCNNPVSTFSLCLLARAYDVAFALVKKFSEFEVTVGKLMQIDKLVHLLESPVFVHLRLQLLDVEAPYHTYLLKSCYGLLMILPQSEAFKSLNDRLTSVCNLRDNLGVKPNLSASLDGVVRIEDSSIYRAGLDARVLLDRFDKVMAIHQKARVMQQQGFRQEQVFVDNGGGGAANKNNTNSNINNSSTHQKKPLSPPGSTNNNNARGNNYTTVGPITANIPKGIGAVISSGVK